MSDLSEQQQPENLEKTPEEKLLEERIAKWQTQDRQNTLTLPSEVRDQKIESHRKEISANQKPSSLNTISEEQMEQFLAADKAYQEFKAKLASEEPKLLFAKLANPKSPSLAEEVSSPRHKLITNTNPIDTETVDLPEISMFTEGITLAKVMGKIPPKQREDFTIVDPAHADREGIYLLKEVYQDFLKMRDAAQADGITLTVLSGFRGFDKQKTIWERKFTGKVKVGGKNLAMEFPNPEERIKHIMTYSSPPGFSRHHAGTDIDLISFEPEYFETEKGAKEYQWLKTNAPKFGFTQTYTEIGDGRSAGYSEEKWHWTHKRTGDRHTVAAAAFLRLTQPSGFLGAEYLDANKLVDKFVLGIKYSKIEEKKALPPIF